MSVQPQPLAKLLEQVAETIQAEQNKFNKSIYQSLPPTEQVQTLQNCYNNNIPVPKISEMTGVPVSTIYSKIDTK